MQCYNATSVCSKPLGVWATSASIFLFFVAYAASVVMSFLTTTTILESFHLRRPHTRRTVPMGLTTNAPAPITASQPLSSVKVGMQATTVWHIASLSAYPQAALINQSNSPRLPPKPKHTSSPSPHELGCGVPSVRSSWYGGRLIWHWWFHIIFRRLGIGCRSGLILIFGILSTVPWLAQMFQYLGPRGKIWRYASRVLNWTSLTALTNLLLKRR